MPGLFRVSNPYKNKTMIKLENPSNAPQAYARLLLQSLSDSPTISLSVDPKPPRKMVNGAWTEDTEHNAQTVAFINDAGDPVSIEGLVAKGDCVEIAGAYKVVLAVRISNGLKGAFAQGGVSKTYAALELVQVVEVWASATKRLYSAGEPAKQGATMSSDGKIAKVA
jgi:hypothetical protein